MAGEGGADGETGHLDALVVQQVYVVGSELQVVQSAMARALEREGGLAEHGAHLLGLQGSAA